MKPLNIIYVNHSAMFGNAVDIFHDYVMVDGEPVNVWSHLFEALTTPEKFYEAMTDGRAVTYLGGIVDFDEIEKTDSIIVVYKDDEPWATILTKDLDW